MPEAYKNTIARLISSLSSAFGIDTEIKLAGRPPSMASSEFLTNKEQGDWAEKIVFNAINENFDDLIAVQYGRSDSLAAGDPGFADFYQFYQNELNAIGKKPDLLIFRTDDVPNIKLVNLDNGEIVRKAIAAIEVRSSSFLANRYASYMEERTKAAESECTRLQQLILREPYATILSEKNPSLYDLICTATPTTFREIDFRLCNWSSSDNLRTLSDYLKSLKEQIKILHKRDYLSITPKVEDIALVNRWIQRFGVRHYYLQVFFDKVDCAPEVGAFSGLN